MLTDFDYKPDHSFVAEPHPLLTRLGAAAEQNAHPMTRDNYDALREWMDSALAGLRKFESAAATALARAEDYVPAKRLEMVVKATAEAVTELQQLCWARVRKAREAIARLDGKIAEAAAEPRPEGWAAVLRELRQGEIRTRFRQLPAGEMLGFIASALQGGNPEPLWAAEADPFINPEQRETLKRLRDPWVETALPNWTALRNDVSEIEDKLVVLVAMLWQGLRGYRGNDRHGVIEDFGAKAVPPMEEFLERPTVPAVRGDRVQVPA